MRKKKIGITFKPENYGSRKEAYDYLIDKNFTVIQENLGNRHEGWKLMSEVMFIYSPLGMGLDCHRTWEALLMGAIVLLPKSAISHHFLDMDLPVVIINNLSELCSENMDEWLHKAYPKLINREKLTSEYLRKKIASKPSL